MFASCGSEPTPYSVSATAERTESVPYTVTDQQAYARAKAYIMAKANAVLRSDDSAGGALAAVGSNDTWDWKCTISVANGIAKINWSETYTGDFWAVSRSEANARADSTVNKAADDEIISFRKALN